MDLFESVLIDKSLNPIFKKDKLSQFDIQRVLETTTWAPSPFNSQPWEFIIIQQQENIKNLAGIIAPAVECPQLEASPAKIKSFLSALPNLILCLNDTSRQDPGENAYKLGFISIGTALANLIITASASAIALQPFWINKNKTGIITALKQYLKIPNHMEVCCFMGLGYTKQQSEVAKTEEPAIVYKNNYGDINRSGTHLSRPLNHNPFTLIKKRKSYRKAFRKQSISAKDEHTLIKVSQSSFTFNNKQVGELIFIQDKKLINTLADLITEMSIKIHLDEGYSKRMQSWFRFTKEEGARKADGILLSLLNKSRGAVFKKASESLDKFSILKPLRFLSIKMMAKDFFGDLLRNSPLLVVFCYNQNSSINSNVPYELNITSIGVVIQNLLLAATSLKMGAQFLSILLDMPEGKRQVKKLLNIPEHVDVIDLIRVGYINTHAPNKLLTISSNIRRPIEKIVHYEFYNSKSAGNDIYR